MLLSMWRNWHLCVAGGDGKWCGHCAPQKGKQRIPQNPSIPLLGVYPRKWKMGVQRKTCTLRLTTALFVTTKKWQQRKGRISGWVDKQHVTHPRGGVLLTIRRGEADTPHAKREPWKHGARWKKPDTKGHVLYDSIYIKFQSRQLHRERK